MLSSVNRKGFQSFELFSLWFLVISKAMTKAAYLAHLCSSPHLDCNETYLSYSLISSSVTALWQPYCFGTILFDLRQETKWGWSLRWLLRKSFSVWRCVWQERRKKGQKENGDEIQFFLFEMVKEIVLCRCLAQNTCKGSSLRSTSLLYMILALSLSLPPRTSPLQPHLILERHGRNSKSPHL